MQAPPPRPRYRVSTILWVFAAGELSCQVNNPTLQAIYPLQSVLNIQRTFNASFSPLKNVSGTVLSPNGSPTVYAQLFYSGVEQFFCTASSCTQSSTSTTDLFYSTVSMYLAHVVLRS
ncbi:hypothetical protein L210DRAFT_3546390 [Boletus edulis BED1]|uniref:Uncharacterized protein n=1 Tax=Boletus edulis BED1 TaxID=1328754 RepID=A0AAD4BR52_BOLED|nr:hypothetical protein L210DRAFT_3546390 [Boletus edulis BED1]